MVKDSKKIEITDHQRLRNTGIIVESKTDIYNNVPVKRISQQI